MAEVEASNGTQIKPRDLSSDISPTKLQNGVTGVHVEKSVAAEANGAATASSDAPSPKKLDTPRKPRGPTKAQQLNQLYSLPLPLRTFPLPTFVPHNPLSLIHLVYAWLSQTLRPPTSHPPLPCRGLFSAELRAVHVTDSKDIRTLWEQGFYGKGSLSRSELSWLDREKRRVGQGASKTSEEVTRQRRAERQQVKWERARIQQEAIEAKRKEEELAAVADVAGAVIGHSKPLIAHIDIVPTGPRQLLSMPNSSADTRESNEEVGSSSYTPTNTDAAAPSPSEPISNESITSQVDDTTPSTHYPPATTAATSMSSAKSVRFSPTKEQQIIASDPIVPSTSVSNLHIATPDDSEEMPLVIKDSEHLQLTCQEAFFLHYGLGVLDVCDSTTHTPIPTPRLFKLFRQSSYFPTQDIKEVPRPDDEFMINYVIYHHFRSLGWVVRGGVKFGVDYLLYNRGPVFSHAEFAVIILPSYSDVYWKSEDRSLEYPQGRKEYSEKKLRQRGKWSWMHAVNRVNAQVKKTVVLAYVDVPKPLGEEVEMGMGVDQILARYKVREIVLKRWVSNRSRD